MLLILFFILIIIFISTFLFANLEIKLPETYKIKTKTENTSLDLNPNVLPYKHLGCFKHKKYNCILKEDPWITIEECYKLAKARDYRYFGIHNARFCLASTELPNNLQKGKCKMKCYNKDTGGDFNAVDAFRIKGVIPNLSHIERYTKKKDNNLQGKVYKKVQGSQNFCAKICNKSKKCKMFSYCKDNTNTCYLYSNGKFIENDMYDSFIK